jgi:hypothetical protein
MPADMTSSIVFVIRGDPRTSHRPVEALRIALGLAAGEHDVTVVLEQAADRLLAKDADDVVDVEILEKYLPSFKQLGIPFIMTAPQSRDVPLQEGFSLRYKDYPGIQQLIKTATHTLVF